MSTKAKRSGKIGRPPSGKKAYCIRMKPDTYDDLLRAAQKNGYQSLGQSFDNLPVELLFKASNPARPYMLNPVFREYSNEVASALGEMRLIVESNPMLDDDEENLKAFRNLKREYDNLIRRMASFGIET
ncbi:MAG: hypothetical protein ABSG59_22830 [Verrucomicrobiota bacterium]